MESRGLCKAKLRVRLSHSPPISAVSLIDKNTLYDGALSCHKETRGQNPDSGPNIMILDGSANWNRLPGFHLGK